MLGKRTFQQMQAPVPGGQEGPTQLITLRIMCPGTKVGPIIGRGGEIIKGIRQDSGAKFVKMEDAIPGHPERSILVGSADRPDGPTCGAQDAIQILIDKIVEVSNADGTTSLPEQADISLIVDRAYVGTVIGKQGTQIKAIHAESGASVQTINDQNPLVTPQEQLIKASGELASVKKAVLAVTQKIREAILRGVQPQKHQGGGHHQGHAPVVGGGMMMGGPAGPMMSSAAMMAHRAPAPGGGGGGMMPGLLVETVYRMLVPQSKVGQFIGKGGETIKRMKAETGADIQVEVKPAQPDAPAGGDEDLRMVTCRSSEPGDAPTCGAAEALMRCVDMLVNDKRDDAAATKHLKIIAFPRQLGSVIGIKGATMRDISRATGAQMRVDKSGMPQGVGNPTDEMLLIEGSKQAVLAGCRTVTQLLRGFMIKTQAEQKGYPAPGTAAVGGHAMQPPMGMQAPMGGMMGGMGMMGAAPPPAAGAYGMVAAPKPEAPYYATGAAAQPQAGPYGMYQPHVGADTSGVYGAYNPAATAAAGAATGYGQYGAAPAAQAAAPAQYGQYAQAPAPAAQQQYGAAQYGQVAGAQQSMYGTYPGQAYGQ